MDRIPRLGSRAQRYTPNYDHVLNMSFMLVKIYERGGGLSKSRILRNLRIVIVESEDSVEERFNLREKNLNMYT